MPKPLANGLATWDPAHLVMPVGMNSFMTMTQPMVDAMAEFQKKIFDGAAQFGTEWTEFLFRRLQEDLAVPQRIAGCRSPQEAQQVYADYWKTAFAQYQEEMGRLAKIGESVTQQTAATMKKHADAITHEKQIAA